MFFYVSKILGFVSYPSNAAIALGLLGLVLALLRRLAVALWLMALSVASIAILGVLPVGHALLLPLESRFPAEPAPAQGIAGIIVLGGSFDTTNSLARGEVELNEAAERLTAVAELAREHPEVPIIFTGGHGELITQGRNEAELAGEMLASFGIPRERLVLENRARNTRENAVFTAELVKPAPGARYLLVTSAYHMPRSVGCFRAVGFDVVAHPVDWRTGGTESLALPSRSAAEGLRRVDAATREWIGLAVYRALGYTDALFPAP